MRRSTSMTKSLVAPTLVCMSRLTLWKFVTCQLSFTTITVVVRRAVVRYVYSMRFGIAVPAPCTTTKAPTAPFLFSTPKRILMTMIRGTRFIVGKEAAQIRALETQFRSYLH
jgi:hypothetical protein